MTQAENQALDRYIAGLIKADEASAFEARLARDADLHHQHTLRRELTSFLADGEADMHSFLEGFGDDEFLLGRRFFLPQIDEVIKIQTTTANCYQVRMHRG